jgi:predicted nucleotidyltransferase
VFGDDAVDLLAEKLPGLSLTSLTGAEIDLSTRLKRPVGIVLKSELKGREEEEVLGEMQPL